MSVSRIRARLTAAGGFGPRLAVTLHLVLEQPPQQVRLPAVLVHQLLQQVELRVCASAAGLRISISVRSCGVRAAGSAACSIADVSNRAAAAAAAA